MSRHLRRLERQKTVGEKVGEALRASSAAQSLPLRALAEALDGASDDGSDPSAVLCNPHATMMGTAAAAKKAKRKRAKAAAAAAAAAAEATGDDSDEEEVEEECEVAGVEEDTEEEEAGAVVAGVDGDSGDAGAEDGEGRRRRPAEQTLRRRRGPASACAVGVAPASLPQRRDEDLRPRVPGTTRRRRCTLGGPQGPSRNWTPQREFVDRQTSPRPWLPKSAGDVFSSEQVSQLLSA